MSRGAEIIINSMRNKVYDIFQNELKDKAIEQMKKSTKEVVYDAGRPTRYIRDYRLINSVDTTPVNYNKMNEIEMSIIHNSSILKGYTSYTGRSITDISEIVKNGASPLIFGNGFWTMPRDYEADFNEKFDLEKELKKILTNKNLL